MSVTKSYRLAVIAGDGVGPEVMAEALRVLDVVSEKRALRFELTRYPFGSEHYLKTKETFPAEALEEIRGLDAVLLGAIGDPRIETGLLERAIIAGLRFGLDLYINLRPVQKLYDERLCPLKEDAGGNRLHPCGRTPRTSTPEWAGTSNEARPTRSRSRR
ncbi:MAG: isocitrate/isopropylmalate family dehydrogenase [Candidatus Eisenbacteria bacterium]